MLPNIGQVGESKKICRVGIEPYVDELLTAYRPVKLHNIHATLVMLPQYGRSSSEIKNNFDNIKHYASFKTVHVFLPYYSTKNSAKSCTRTGHCTTVSGTWLTGCTPPEVFYLCVFFIVIPYRRQSYYCLTL